MIKKLHDDIINFISKIVQYLFAVKNFTENIYVKIALLKHQKSLLLNARAP